MSRPHTGMRRLVMLLSLVVASFLLVVSIEFLGNPWFDRAGLKFSIGLLPHTQLPSGQLPTRSQTVQVHKFVSGLVNSLPAGTDVDQADFPKLLDAETVKYLQAYQIQHIQISGQHLTATLPFQQITTSAPSADLRLGPQITADIVRDPATGLLTFANVDGIQAKVSWLVGWMTLQEMQFSAGTAGNTIIDLSFDTRFGQVKRKVSVAADGTASLVNPPAPDPNSP